MFEKNCENKVVRRQRTADIYNVCYTYYIFIIYYIYLYQISAQQHLYVSSI